MTHSPAPCVGSLFIPIASLWQPPQAMREIWRASDPSTGEWAWVTSPSTPTVSTWWAAWLGSQLLAWGAYMAKSDPLSAGTIGLASDAFKAVAAVALVMLMRGVAARQARSAARLG